MVHLFHQNVIQHKINIHFNFKRSVVYFEMENNDDDDDDDGLIQGYTNSFG